MKRRSGLLREESKILVSRLLKHWPASRLSTRVVHLVGSPTLHEIYVESALLTTSPEEAAEAVLGESVDYAHEYAEVRDRVTRQRSEGARYPDYYVVEEGTAYLLYMLVRHLKPALTVEVGVADGRSTEVILSALDTNDSGRLISIDIDEEAGAALAGHPRWQLRTHSPGRASSRQLGILLSEVGPPELFFHDAMHTYDGQYADYLAAWEHMRPGSLFVSDDVDESWAFVDLARRFRLTPVVLTDRRKAAGMLRRPDISAGRR